MTRPPPATPVPQKAADADSRGHGKSAGNDGAASPSEIARETLRQLATSRVPPTPDNYRDLYVQISGSIAEDAFPIRALKAIAAALPRSSPEALRIARLFESGVTSAQWPALRQAIMAICETQGSGQKQWATLIRDLATHLERAGDGPNLARKREALDHVLAGSPDPDQLFARLGALIRSWGQTPDETSLPVVSAASVTKTGGLNECIDNPLRPLLANLLTRGVIPLTDGDEALVAAARELSSAVLSAPVESIVGRLDHLITRMEWTGEEHRAIRQALLTLLRLIIDNIRELVIDDSWLHGQLSIISAAFDGVLDIRLLDEVEHRLRDVIEKQSHLKRQLSDAQQRLKSMLAGFIDRLSDFSTVTGDYQDVLEQGAQRISKAQNIEELSDLVEEILRETHNTRESTKRSGEELSRLREEVDSANQHILRLQRELDETSELVRHDPLTGTLNRKGLDEALAREISRMRRLGTTLCIGLLDIDNFKQINDAHGHLVGDDALRHLSAIVRETLRPQDAVARYGGEEFLILLPDTELDQANAILVRLQRELTRRFFLANTEHLLITFSAGISRLSHDEDPMIAIERADKAMYAAKRAGKNRVLNAA